MTLAPEQRDALDRIAEERIASMAAVPGRVLRLRGVETERLQNGLPSGLVRVGGKPPHETYDLTLAGALRTKFRNELSKGVLDVVAFFRALLRDDDRATNYSSDQLLRHLGREESSLGMLLFAVQLAGLGGSGSFGVRGFQFQFPYDVEQLLDCKTIEDIVALRVPREEYFDNRATGVELELEGFGGHDAQPKPWDPSKIRISTKPFSLRHVVDMISDGDIDLAPDFQRLYVWSALQKSRLVESILLGIPLPAFYFNQDTTGTLQVVDGVQRLTTIFRFATDQERLSDLEYLKELEGRAFSDLDVVLRRRFQQTQIFVNIIEPQTPDEIKFDVFRRINTGGSPLTPQEIRHCMSGERSRTLLRRFSAFAEFHRATDGAFERERRMVDRELVLRFCAFRRLSDLETYAMFSSLDSFLLDFTRRLDGRHPSKPALTKQEIDELERDFKRAMKSATAVFGNAAFRKYPTSAKKRGPINRALFESWAVALADYEPLQLIPHRESIVNAARSRMEDQEYSGAVSQGTGKMGKVRIRFGAASEILAEALA